jgi:UDP-3-O-[3-hydroxymyristoyl] glucosamine N-acyltransferase
VSPRFTLDELAGRLGAEVIGDGGHEVSGVRAIDDAGPEDLSFLHNPKYAEKARSSRAGAILVADAGAFPGRDLLVCREPYLATARALELFYPAERPAAGVHPSAVLAENVVVEDGASIGPHCVIGGGSRIGNDSVIGPGCVLGSGVMIGAACTLHPRVVIEDRCRIGDRCIIHSGTVVGADGFGFATVEGVHHKVPQVGIVVLEDDVEVGANVCIDRAALGETRIGRGTKIDNLVQVAHNVQVGEHCLLVAQVGISGSTEIGHHAVLAGQAGIVGHIRIGSGAVVGAQAGVTKDVPDGATVAGYPARKFREWLKTNANMARLDDLRQLVKRLEARIAELEGAHHE